MDAGGQSGFFRGRDPDLVNHALLDSPTARCMTTLIRLSKFYDDGKLIWGRGHKRIRS